MNSKKFFCKGCHKLFDTPKIYEEKHGLDTPPYERVAVCPSCNSDDFLKFDTLIEKTEIAEKLLLAVMHFNRYGELIKDVFGNGADNADFCMGVELIAELISEMFDFIDSDAQKKILRMSSGNEAKRILMYLKGEL